jgi:plastocyanin
MRISVVLLMMACAMLAGDLSAPKAADEPEVVVVTVDSTNFRFSPATVELTEGDAVRFFWSGQAIGHNAVETEGAFSTGEPERDVDETFVFEEGSAGTYTYVCEPHEAMGMVGTITVNPGPEPSEEPASEAPLESEDTPWLAWPATALAVMVGARLHRGHSEGNG